MIPGIALLASLVENANSWPHPRPNESETLGWGLQVILIGPDIWEQLAWSYYLKLLGSADLQRW